MLDVSLGLLHITSCVTPSFCWEEKFGADEGLVSHKSIAR